MKKRKNKPTLGKKIITIIASIICIILIPIIVINLTLIVKSYTNKDEVPSIGNTMPMVVLTDSMYPEIESGDLIILKKINPENIVVGDIITFFDPNGNGTTTVTHRVIEIINKDGEIFFKTKGDANNTEDKFQVSSDKIVGIYTKRIKNVGNIAMFMATTKGLIVCVIVPLILFVGLDIISRKKYDKKINEDRDKLLEELEKLRSEKQQKEE